jgi:coenzyme F420-reducing hydrogenase beta subunit
MRADAEGFLYPHIDASKCVNCGLCQKACPSINPANARHPRSVYAAMAKDDVLRLASSSGGVFSLLASDILSKGGVVFGAAFNHGDWHVYHRPVETEVDLAELRGSKYVQSDVGDCYRQVKAYLDAGRKVLFSGTPCQIAALNKFLAMYMGTPKDNLLLVDVVCHAVPSPLAWRKYLEKRASSIYPDRVGGLRDIRRISSRRKDCGWKRFSLSLSFANDKEYLSVFSDDPFMRGFLAELYNRPSCHNCPCKNLRSGSDITIADFWGVAKQLPEMDDDKGTSLVIVNTEKGAESFSGISHAINYKVAQFDDAVKSNGAVARSTIPHRNRSRFFRNVNKSDFDVLVNRMLRPTFKLRIRTIIGRVFRVIRRFKMT